MCVFIYKDHELSKCSIIYPSWNITFGAFVALVTACQQTLLHTMYMVHNYCTKANILLMKYCAIHSLLRL